MLRIYLFVSILLVSFFAKGQESDYSAPIIFIYDASGSMWGQIDGKTKMKIASDVLTESVHGLDEYQQVGLVAYGHRQEGDCQDVEFLVPMSNLDKSKLTSSLKEIKPLGRTPLAFSATQVIDVLRKDNIAATIILITDGIESCGGDICAVIKAAKEDGIGLKLHIIGFGLKESETAQLKCAAQAGEGQYYDASDADQLGDVLDAATSAPVKDPPKNVSVSAVKNGALIDAYIKAYPGGGTTYETSTRTYNDTGYMHLAPGSYRLDFTALGGSDVAPISLHDVVVEEGNAMHKSVSFDAGNISVNTLNNKEGLDALVKIIDPNSGKRVSGGRTYGREKTYEVNPGIYNIEISPLKIKGSDIVFRKKGVEVMALQTVSLSHDFKGGRAMIGAADNGVLVDVAISIVDLDMNKNTAGGRTYTSPSNNPKEFLLMPGNYKVLLKGLKDYKDVNKEFSMEIKSGETFEKITEF